MRPIGVRRLVVGAMLVVLLAGCGDEGDDRSPTGPSTSPSDSDAGCLERGDVGLVTIDADLDGDGAAEEVAYSGPKDCPGGPVLMADVAGQFVTAPVEDELPVTRRDLKVVQVPGRAGQVILATPHHPRGGFQARLFGYADGSFAELTVDDSPIFPFVATDVTTTPLSARCIPDGFELLEAQAHEPIGILPAWDVFRTTYSVEGNTVTKGERTEIADNVLDEELSRDYRPLTKYQLFENCLVAR